MLDFDELMFFAGAAMPGQLEFTASGTWTVPMGVDSISMVCVQAAGNYLPTQIEIDGVIVCRAQNNGYRIGDGGGDGGTGGTSVNPGVGDPQAGGGGGAGGYTGNGGAGVTWGQVTPQPTGDGAQGGTNGYGGKGIGLKGVGSPPASDSSGFFGGSYGGGNGGATSFDGGSNGGALAWRNNVAVIPGQVVTATIYTPPANSAPNGRGAARIMWGGGRSYPNNAGDV